MQCNQPIIGISVKSQKITKIKPLIHSTYQMHYLAPKKQEEFANKEVVPFPHPIHGSEQSGTEE